MPSQWYRLYVLKELPGRRSCAGHKAGEASSREGVGRIGTVRWRRGACGKFQAGSLVLAHLGNIPVCKEER